MGRSNRKVPTRKAKASFLRHGEKYSVFGGRPGARDSKEMQQEAEMSDGSSKLDVKEVAQITNELHEGRLSRGGLSNRLKGLGLGFGAAFVLGMTGAHAATASDANVVLKSNNPALASIIQSGSETGQAATDDKMQQLAWFRRYFHRFFNRWYRRF
jgi:hypothetical protein